MNKINAFIELQEADRKLFRQTQILFVEEVSYEIYQDLLSLYQELKENIDGLLAIEKAAGIIAERYHLTER